MLLIMAEEDVEGAGKIPQGETQEEQKPFDVIDHHCQRVYEWVLGRLQHPAMQT